MGRTACTEPQCLCKGDLYLYLLRIIINVIPPKFSEKSIGVRKRLETEGHQSAQYIQKA